MAFLTKTKDVILLEALRKLQETTPISSISPGSVARAIAEVIGGQLGDMYSILDFNFAASTISQAQGRSLDLIGSLYNIQRKTLSDIANIDKQIGAFYFYVDNPAPRALTIPLGTAIYTSINNTIGIQFSYVTTEDTVILPGRLRAFATLRPRFGDSVFTAGPHTITTIDPSFVQPLDVTIKATNPKTIEAQTGVETDDNYRTRIIKAVRTSAGGTTEAVRFTGLNVSGVRDITIRDAPYGLGSFEALIVSEDNLINGPVVRAASAAMGKVRPVGTRMFVRQPDLLPMSVHASIVLRADVVADATNVARRVEVAILRYLNTMLIGTTLVYTQLIQAIIDAHDAVADVTITQLSANGVEILRKNYTSESDQQIIPGEVKVSVAS